MFSHQKRIYSGKRKGCNQSVQTWQDMCILWPVCQDGGVFIEGKGKLKEGEVRATELYYKHEILPVGFS